MKERPILFNGPMVRAILEGRKVQTRRIVKIPDFVKDEDGDNDMTTVAFLEKGAETPGFWAWMTEYPEEGGVPINCPYGQPGDRLWVRETWKYCCTQRSFPNNPNHEHTIEYQADSRKITYSRPDDSGLPKQRKQRDDEDYYEDYMEYLNKWWRASRPSIHMPRWASRITLEVTGVRVERLNDITEEDAKAEGVYFDGRRYHFMKGKGAGLVHAKSAFATLWRSINGTCSWNENPWVWVVEFKRLQP